MGEAASSNDAGALSENITQTYDHIFTLVPFCESEDYSEEAKSAFRKTVMIHTASIVEAMLYFVLVTSFTDDDAAEYYSYWKLSDQKVLYKIDEKHEIVGGHYVKYPGKTSTEKMNLGQINDFLYRNEAISSKLRDKIDYVREKRLLTPYHPYH